MKYLDFQKMLKQIKERGMFLNNEVVVIRRDVYDLEMLKVQNYLKTKKEMVTAIKPEEKIATN